MFIDKIVLTDVHKKYLDEMYFPLVCKTRRYPRYNNKRGLDPNFKMYINEIGYDIPKDWGLPQLNCEAAYMQLAKYKKNQPQFSGLQVLQFNMATEWLHKEFYPYMGNSKILSLEEVVSELDMSSSPGYPFTQCYTTKRALFDNDPCIKDWLEKDFERLAVDRDWTCIGTSSQKEELRTAEKIQANSIRNFLAMPLDATVHGGRMFADMNNKMYESYLRSSSAVGMSPFDGNWHRLITKLKKFGNGFALDESQYDASLYQFLLLNVCYFRWNCLKSEFQTPENFQRFKTYYRNLIYTVTLTPDGTLVMKGTGNPSGSCNTISDNTLILFMLMSFAWINISWGTKWCSYRAFDDNTRKALVGDDNTWTVSDPCLKFYNARNVCDVWMKHLNITTTTDSYLPRPAMELDFLSAHSTIIRGKACPVYSRVKLATTLLFAPMKEFSPAVSLVRAAAIYLNAWADREFALVLRNYIDWLLRRYDQALHGTTAWEVAKTQIHSDLFLESLFTGISQHDILSPQSFKVGRSEVLKQMGVDRKSVV